MSARALLLSPDDQAVSAITGVLEELGVLCERPRDGATAAQKLNSQTYDLVLVDCDNLPAAKLIFDVCRRSHSGTTIPIAIVDGRAGLPTAFRLGAELILTKPVAKDQARTTIRTAVSRVRKEDPARAHAMDLPSMETPAPSIPEPRAQAAAAGAVSSPAAMAAAPPAEIAHASEVAPPSASAVTEEPKAAPQMARTIPAVPAAEPETQNEKRALATNPIEKTPVKPLPVRQEEAVREQLSKVETELETPITFSSFDQSKRPKGRGGLVALVLLGMVGAGFYAAWTLQPDFRAMVKPQIDKALDIADNLTGQKKAAPVQSAQPVAKTPASQTPAPTQSAPVPVANATPASDTTSQSATDSTSATAETPATAAPAPTAAKSAPADDAEKSPEESAKAAAATPAESELPWEKDTVILSSKGAEKRLVHHVQPAFPKGSRAQKADGTVVLKTLVGGNGSVQGVRLVEGNPAFATAATKAVKQWRYKPYIRDGARTPFQTIVIVDFQQP